MFHVVANFSSFLHFLLSTFLQKKLSPFRITGLVFSTILRRCVFEYNKGKSSLRLKLFYQMQRKLNFRHNAFLYTIIITLQEKPIKWKCYKMKCFILLIITIHLHDNILNSYLTIIKPFYSKNIERYQQILLI